MSIANSLGYATQADSPKQATLTDKAIRVNSSAMEVLSKLHAIKQRISAPTPSVEAAPPCDHALFAIEGAQQLLNEASVIADSILSSL